MEREYFYVEWDYYYGTGTTIRTRLCDDEVENDDCGRKVWAGHFLYDTYAEAEQVLDYHYQD